MHDLLYKAHNEYHHELTYIIPSEIAFTHVDLPSFYEIDLNYIVEQISKRMEKK